MARIEGGIILRIIERGNPWYSKEQPVKFHCFRCGCTFEMDNTEYKNGDGLIYAYCPSCGWLCNPIRESDR